MCGIAFRLRGCRLACAAPPWLPVGNGELAGRDSGFFPATLELLEAIRARGPDAAGTADLVLKHGSAQLSLAASTLSLRGAGAHDKLLPCPLRDGDRNWLLFNGEIFGCSSTAGPGPNDNDACWILSQLSLLCQHSSPDTVNSLMLDFLDSTSGPWALIFWSDRYQRLYFGRDVIGRRSLVINSDFTNGMWVSSAAPPSRSGNIDYAAVSEVPPLGLCILDFTAGDETVGFSIERRSSSNLAIEEARLPRGGPSPLIANLSFLPASMLYTSAASLSQALPHRDFYTCLMSAVQDRLVGIDQLSSGVVGLLFSGGLDSMVLAAMIAQCQPAVVELVNVSFGNKPSPDRGYRELCELFHGDSATEFRLVLVDVTENDVRQHLPSVRDLLFPASTPMDVSIGSALWFAARGVGRLPGAKEDYRLTCKVLMSGLGADELLAGYKGRHRNVFARSGVTGLLRELNADLGRLWWRNLGRDDRVVACHGREIRHPFLDESLVKLCHRVNPNHLFDLTLPDGTGDKKVLRDLARDELGFSESSYRRSKKAMQFGSNSKKVIESKSGEGFRDLSAAGPAE